MIKNERESAQDSEQRLKQEIDTLQLEKAQVCYEFLISQVFICAGQDFTASTMPLILENLLDNSTAGVLRSLENLRNLRNLKNLEKSGNFSDQGSFRSLVVFTHSLSIQMRNHFLGLPRTTGKNLKKVGEVFKICSGKPGKIRESF